MGAIRLLQLVAFAALCLFVLKFLGLWLSGGYVLSGHAPAKAQDQPAAESVQSEAEQSKPEAEQEAEREATPKPQTEAAAAPQQEQQDAPAEPKQEPAKADASSGEAKAPAEQSGGGEEAVPEATKTELAVLQSLSERRKMLEKRERELELRENLLKAAEKRVAAQISELKSIEKRIETELKGQDDERMAQYMRLVKMYSAMKPKDAAKIFNRLDLDILTAMVMQMRPRTMSAIMAAMEPAAARRLTMELAKIRDSQTGGASKLPKIGASSPG